MEFAQVLCELMDKNGLSAYKLSKDTGISDRLIGYWKSGDRLPNAENLLIIAKYFGISVDFLLTGKAIENDSAYLPTLSIQEQDLLNYFNQLSDIDKTRVSERAETLAELAAERAAEQAKKAEETIQSSTKKYEKPIQFLYPADHVIDINYYDMPSSAGTGSFLDHTHYEKVQIKRTPEAEQADFAIPIVGNSMEPDFHSGDVVLVKSCPYVNIGEIGIFVLDGDAFIKQYDGDKLVSLNEEYPPLMLSKFETAVCLGRVIGIAELVEKNLP